MQAAEPGELGVLRPGIMRKTSVWAPCFSLVWKPTMFHSVPSALSWRSWTTAWALSPACGLVRPTGFIGPWRRVSRPRSAITSIGRQPSK